MKIIIGIVIGSLMGIFCMALMSASNYDDAYMEGANDFKEYVINRLVKMQEHTDNVTCEQLMEELNDSIL